MGSSNGITRGQLRPHFSGRSPPFLVAALCVGLGILGVSYWSLCSQYNDLEEELKKALQQSDTVKKSEDVIQNQLHLREEEFSRAQKVLQTKEQELSELQNKLKTKADEINSLNTRLESIKEVNTKCDEELGNKKNELGDALTKLKDLEQQNDKFKQLKDDQNKDSNGIKLENERLKTELEELKKKIE